MGIGHFLHTGVATGLHRHAAVGAGEVNTARTGATFASSPAGTALILGHARESTVDMHSSSSPGGFLHAKEK